MILGMSTAMFTWLHVAISLAALVAGVVVLFGLATGRRRDGWTALFLATTILTSVTGFFFPSPQLLPSHVIGFLSLLVLVAAVVGRYVFRLAGAWRWIYVLSAVIAVYFNMFVAVVQAFQKLPGLAALAPTQSELPFLIIQLIVIAVFVWLGIAGLRKSRPPLRSAA